MKTKRADNAVKIIVIAVLLLGSIHSTVNSEDHIRERGITLAHGFVNRTAVVYDQIICSGELSAVGVSECTIVLRDDFNTPLPIQCTTSFVDFYVRGIRYCTPIIPETSND